MRRNEKSWTELDELLEPFLPDEAAENATTVAVELRKRLVKLEQQVMSQYTSMAAYATIARQDVESTRAESRSDLDRSQATLIGLLEKLRNEVSIRMDGLERRSSGGDLSGDADSRLGRVEVQLASAREAVQLCVRENQELRGQVAELVEQRMREQGWLVSGAPQALSLR